MNTPLNRHIKDKIRQQLQVLRDAGLLERGRFLILAYLVSCRSPRPIIAASSPTDPAQVRARYTRLKPIREIKTTQRGWTLDVLNVVRRLVESRRRGHKTLTVKAGMGQSLLTSSPTNEFTTTDAYIFERELEQLHPDNRNVRPKIRQQLQILRDTGLLIHVESGHWRLP